MTVSNHTVQQQSQRMTLSKHTGSDVREFCIGQHVMVSDYRGKLPWIQSTVVGKLDHLLTRSEPMKATDRSNAANFTCLRTEETTTTNPGCNTEADSLQSSEHWCSKEDPGECQSTVKSVNELVVRRNKQKFVRSRSVQSLSALKLRHGSKILPWLLFSIILKIKEIFWHFIDNSKMYHIMKA